MNCPQVSDGARKSKVTVSIPRMTALANPIARSAAARQKIPKAVTCGNPQYLTTNLRIPSPIPSKFARLPMRLQRYPSYYPPYFRQVTSLTVFLFLLAYRSHRAHSTLTYHQELREAQLDSDFDRVIVKLAHEWYYEGASVSSTLFRLVNYRSLLANSSFCPSQPEVFFPSSIFSSVDSRRYYTASTRVYSAFHPATSSWSTTLPNAR
jgi:hypothetical protein